MSIIYILIPIAILLTAIGIYIFFWAVKTDQFDDLEKQGMSILFDDDVKTKDNENLEDDADNLINNQAIESEQKKINKESINNHEH
ncbi:MAG: cbb3-type cytochrome oxidase assembly protein CcoS [Alteromonadaceae bacterium]|nr:cbb3-type cytochrome oxidase assembly protein CcoS [Alteromonadaceae bacterium]